MEIQLAVAAANMAPRGYKIAGYEIKDAKTGNSMLSRGKGDKQDAIRAAINKYTKMQDKIEFTLYLEGKSGDEKEVTTRYEWDSNEAVPLND